MRFTEKEQSDIFHAFEAGLSLLNSTTKSDKKKAQEIAVLRPRLLLALLQYGMNDNTFEKFLSKGYASQKVFFSSALMDKVKAELPKLHPSYEFSIDDSLSDNQFKTEEIYIEGEGRVSDRVFEYNFKSVI